MTRSDSWLLTASSRVLIDRKRPAIEADIAFPGPSQSRNYPRQLAAPSQRPNHGKPWGNGTRPYPAQGLAPGLKALKCPRPDNSGDHRSATDVEIRGVAFK